MISLCGVARSGLRRGLWSGQRSRISANYLHSAASTGEVTSHVAEVDGQRLHYVRAGSGRRVLLLMPGALGSAKTDFKKQIDHLDRGLFSLVAWDPPGYGLSRPPDRKWPADFLRRDAQSAASLMQHIGIERYSVIGWSDGGTTALLLSILYPQRVERIVIWGAAASVMEADVKLNESIRNIDDWSPRMRAPFEAVYGETYFRKLCHDWVDAYNEYASVKQGDICTKELGAIACPTLIIHGQKDALVGQAHPDFLHASIKHSKLVNLPEGKHNLHMRYHEVLNDLVQRFVTDPEHFSLQSKL